MPGMNPLSPSFYAGVAVILLSVLVHPLVARKARRLEHADMLGAAESKGLAD